MPDRRGRRLAAKPLVLGLFALGLHALPGVASAGLELDAARVERLDNGLTIIVLEEPALPLVSVQMVYRVGARHEPPGATGLAHFLEHMAFRSSANFPDTQLVSNIYAVGGEWHGYTWLDQTTYFATVPKEHLDLLLRIEADRMARLDIPSTDVEAERGAVLAEMHGYENDPAAVLQDHVMYLSFLAHPYRNNTIGWESDVRGIRHEELVAFYRRHYHPGNAVLAVVGDVDANDVLQRVRALFGSFEGAPATPPPRTVEPPQRGERRIRLHGAVQRKHFKIAWHAPSVHSPDFAAFLVLQDLLGGGSGVSFLQNDWGTAARPGSPLAAVTNDITSWYPPSDQEYVYAVSGSTGPQDEEAALEAEVAAAIDRLVEAAGRADEASRRSLASAKERVHRALRFDVQTTEDAAHQLAFFAGMDALDVLTALPAAVDGVELRDVARVAVERLGRPQRTIGWLLPVEDSPDGSLQPAGNETPGKADSATVANPLPGSRATARSSDSPAGTPVGEPITRPLPGGTLAIVQRSPLSATVSAVAVLPGMIRLDGFSVRHNEPGWGLSSVEADILPGELSATLERLAIALKGSEGIDQGPPVGDGDPLTRLEWHFRDILGLQPPVTGPGTRPLLVVVSGDVDLEHALAALQEPFGSTAPPPAPGRHAGARTPNAFSRMEVESRLERSVAQEALGYVVPAPGPRDPDAAAWRMALYLVSHGYEGRLGEEAISRRGLVYYIDSAYRSDGRTGWITLATGVDPQKLPSMRRLMRAELQRLLLEPPSQGDLEEARAYLLGRRVSAAQSNPELAERLAREWLWYGAPTSYKELKSRLESVTLEDLKRILPAFTAGAIVAVRNPEPAH